MGSILMTSGWSGAEGHGFSKFEFARGRKARLPFPAQGLFAYHWGPPHFRLSPIVLGDL
jgi:hypothetical protein